LSDARQRLPNEVKKKLYISRFQASLKGIMKYDTDGDPLNAFVKHIEVITAALGTTFRDITRLKKISNPRPNALEDRRPKQLLRPPFMSAAVFNAAHDSSASASPSDQASTMPTPVLCKSGVGATLASPSGDLQQAMLLPSQVEEPQLAPQKSSPARSSKPAMLSMGIFSGSNNTGGVPAVWGEEMLRKCEETLATLRRIEQDARAIL
jgi:hypothetical protein